MRLRAAVTASAGDGRSAAPVSMSRGIRASIVALASPWRGMVLDWTLVSSTSSMLMFHQCGRLSGGIAQRKARADSYHHVGRLHHFVELVHLLPFAPRAEAEAVRQRMAVRDGSLASAGRNHRYVCRLRQLDQGFLGVGSSHSAAREYERRVRLGDDVGGFPQVFVAGHDSRDAGGIPQLDLFSLHTGVGRNLKQNGTRTTRAHLPERFEYTVRDIPGTERESLPLGHGPCPAGPLLREPPPGSCQSRRAGPGPQ